MAQTFIMLTKLAHGALKTPEELERLEKSVMDRIFAQCTDVEWIGNYAVFGPYDYVDVFRAPNMATAAKVSTLIRTFGHAHTEIWPAVEWKEFKEMIRHLPGRGE